MAKPMQEEDDDNDDNTDNEDDEDNKDDDHDKSKSKKSSSSSKNGHVKSRGITWKFKIQFQVPSLTKKAKI